MVQLSFHSIVIIVKHFILVVIEEFDERLLSQGEMNQIDFEQVIDCQLLRKSFDCQIDVDSNWFWRPGH